MAKIRSLALLLAVLPATACYEVETESRDLPPRESLPMAEAPPPRPSAPLPAPRSEPVPPPTTRPTATFQVAPDRVPRAGLCRIWYEGIPDERQPPAMTCARAHRVAREHGGRVIWADSDQARQDGKVASIDYGRLDFEGVPPDALPPAGYCRVWKDDLPPARQPPPGRCPDAEREARREGGRLLYMPSSDVR
jgi:hypothetical protein